MTNTPYDDVFRTLLTDCTELIIPVVNEIFHMNYTGKEQIYLLQNEHFIQAPDNTTQERITDSSFKIIEGNGNAHHYHIECQSTSPLNIKMSEKELKSKWAVRFRTYFFDTKFLTFTLDKEPFYCQYKNTPVIYKPNRLIYYRGIIYSVNYLTSLPEYPLQSAPVSDDLPLRHLRHYICLKIPSLIRNLTS